MERSYEIDIPGVLRLVRIVHPILQQVQRHTKRRETEFFVQAKLLESEEVLIHVFSKVAANKLLAAVNKGANAINASIRIESRALFKLVMDFP